MTQTQLAQKSRLTQAMISRIETGKEIPRASTICRLAAALGLSSGDLFESPGQSLRYDRFEIDRVSRSIVTGERTMSPVFNQLADDIASLIIQKLKAYKVKGAKRVQRKRWNVRSRFWRFQQRYPALVIKQILPRVDKLLGGLL